MILDNFSLFSDKQDLFIAAAGSIPSTKVYDLGIPGKTALGDVLKRRLGGSGMIPFSLSINESVLGAYTSINIRIRTSASVDGGGALNGVIKDVLSVNVLKADLVKGYYFPIMILPRDIKQQFMDVEYDVVGGAITASVGAGHVTAGFVAAVDGNNSSEANI